MAIESVGWEGAPRQGATQSRVMFAVIGEALIDIVRRAGGDTVEHIGGSPANVALGLARLRAPVQLLTCVGDDERGIRIRESLTDAGVGMAAARVCGGSTSTATASLDDAGRATYEFDLRWDPGRMVVPGGVRVLHTGSLATVVEPGATGVRALLEASDDALLVSFDPNCRPAIMGPVEHARATIEQVVGTVHLVKVSDEDLGWLYPEAPVGDVMRRWLDRGARLVVVTRGSRGAWAMGRAAEVWEAAPPIEVVDTVGAGDSFTAAMLHALALVGATFPEALGELGEDTLKTVLHRAVVAAALTCTRSGANPPDTTELDRALSGIE